MSRRLSPEERRLWGRVARTVRPAPGRKFESEEDAPASSGGSVGAEPGPVLAPAVPKRPRKPGPPEDLSGQRRIRRGQSEIDARLDLHGHTQDTAHRELVSFIL